MTTPEQVDLWRQSSSEHQRLEFKEAKTQFDTRRLHEYCVALANEGGGYLLLGVAESRRARLSARTRSPTRCLPPSDCSRPLAFAWISRQSRIRKAGCWSFTFHLGRAELRTTSMAST